VLIHLLPAGKTAQTGSPGKTAHTSEEDQRKLLTIWGRNSVNNGARHGRQGSLPVAASRQSYSQRWRGRKEEKLERERDVKFGRNGLRRCRSYAQPRQTDIRGWDKRNISAMTTRRRKIDWKGESSIGDNDTGIKRHDIVRLTGGRGWTWTAFVLCCVKAKYRTVAASR
jgi:hypothetical protein